MKIYNKIVIDMNTLEVLEEDSFEYDGPLALCEDGGDGGDGDGDSGEGGEGNGGDGGNGDGDGGGGGDFGGSDPGGTGGVGAEGPEGMGSGASDAEGGAGSDFGGSDPGGIGGVGAEGPAGMGPGSDMGGMGEADVAGLAQAVANMNAMSTPTGMDYSNISVGPQMAHAQAKEAALEAGFSMEEANAKGAAAAAGYADRNPGMYGTQTLNQMIDAINKTKSVQAVRNFFAGKPSAKDPSVSHMTAFDPHAPDMNLSAMEKAMMDMGLTPAMSAMMSQTPAGKSRAASAFSANLDAAFQGYQDANSPKGFLSAITEKFGKKTAKTAIAAKLAGVPSALSIGLKAAMAASPAMALGPTISAAMAHFGAKNNLGEVANAHAANNPNMSREEAAQDLADIAGMRGFDVSAAEVAAAMDDQWGGGPDTSGQTTGSSDAPERDAPDFSQPEPTTEGGEFNMQPYQYSPLKDYLQDMYGQQGSGFMSDPYSSQGGGGAYNFRY